MAVHIEQDKTQAQAAFFLQSRAEIEEIRLTESSLMCKFELEKVKFPLSVMLKHSAGEAVVSGRKLTVPIKFGFKAVTTEDKAEILVVTCRLSAVYDLAEGYDPTQEQIEAFKEGNAIFNCWTYFREYVQTSVARMNFPPLTLPFLRMVPKPSSPPPSELTITQEIPRAQIEPPKTRSEEGAPKRRRRRKEVVVG